MKKIANTVEKNKEVIRFVALFTVFIALFYFIYYISIDSLGFSKRITANILGFLLEPIGKVIVHETHVSLNAFSVEIIDECTGIFAFILYTSCILAYPTSLKNKGLGIIMGLPGIYAINIFRLFLLAMVGAYYPSVFEFVHVYLWQATFIIFVVIIFTLWIDKVVG